MILIMHRTIPAVLMSVILSGCATHPVKTTQIHRADLQASNYNEFIARRTEELKRMGGPFTDSSVAQTKAEEEARARYGDVPPEISTSWTWGKNADREEQQAKVKQTLEKMDRDALRK